MISVGKAMLLKNYLHVVSRNETASTLLSPKVLEPYNAR